MISIPKNAILAAGLLLFLFGAAACSSQPDTPPMAAVTPLGPTVRAAKSPDCYMPILSVEPAVGYQKVAIVDGWGSLNATRGAVIDAIKRKACETGADALIVLDSAKQNDRRMLYTAAPNSVQGSQTAGTTQGDFIMDREWQPGIGSVGHSGVYVDAVAIIYTKTGSQN